MPTKQTPDNNTPHAPISILACGGALPLEVAEILRQNGHRTNVVSIKGMADADYSSFSPTTVSIGQIGALLAALRADDAREMVIAGHAHRPDLRSLKIDWGFIRNIATVLSLTRGGDDQMLRRIAQFFERGGLTVRSIADVAPALLTPSGTLSGTITPEMLAQARTGLELIQRLGPFDVGQALVMEHGRVIAIEGAEGTDGLLGRLPQQAAGNARRTFVKASKPDQDLRIDLPTVGTATVERCKAAGIQMMALEAGRSLVVSRQEMLQSAAAAGISVLGLAASQPAEQPDHAPMRSRISYHTRLRPSAQMIRDACKGLQLLEAIASPSCPAQAAVITRENIIAINIDESLPEFIDRTEKLAQWGDRREKTKRNRTLILNSTAELSPLTLDTLTQSKVAGLAILNAVENSDEFDELVSNADVRGLFVLSAESA